MKPIHILIVLALLVLAVPPVHAATENISASQAFTCKGAYGILVPLGFENFVPIAQARVYYNWISISVIVLLGAISSSRTTRFVAILIPVFAALFVFMGWMTNANPAHPEQLWGVIVITALLAAMVYMKGSLHERFGIAGPGSMMFNVVFYILILQAVVGFVNSTAIWDYNSAPTASTQYSNIDLEAQVTTVSNTGGLLNDLAQVGTILLEMSIGVLKMFLSMGLALIAFSVVIAIIFPWIYPSAYGPTFLVILQLGIYIIYYMAFMRFVYKPVGEGDF